MFASIYSWDRARGLEVIWSCQDLLLSFLLTSTRLSFVRSLSAYFSYPVLRPSTSLQAALSTIPATASTRIRNEGIQQSVHCLAWTTTPWTIPASRAVCVHPEMEYCLVDIIDDKSGSHGEQAGEIIAGEEPGDGQGLYIVAKSRVSSLSSLLSNAEKGAPKKNVRVVAEGLKGSDLKGTECQRGVVGVYRCLYYVAHTWLMNQEQVHLCLELCIESNRADIDIFVSGFFRILLFSCRNMLFMLWSFVLNSGLIKELSPVRGRIGTHRTWTWHGGFPCLPRKQHPLLQLS